MVPFVCFTFRGVCFDKINISASYEPRFKPFYMSVGILGILPSIKRKNAKNDKFAPILPNFKGYVQGGYTLVKIQK